MTRLTRQENLRMALKKRQTSEYTPQGGSDRSRGAPGAAIKTRLRKAKRSQEREAQSGK